MLTPEITNQIRIHVVENANLTKGQITEIWDLDEEDYKGLLFALRDDPEIVAGPRKVGGLRAHAPRRKDDQDLATEEGPVLLSSPWEQETVARLIAILSHKELEDLLEGSHQSLRYQLGGRRGTKQELASALVIRHGTDLLADKEIRLTIGRRCDVSPPERWVSGKHSALAFVRAIAFPSCLAGDPAEPALPDFVALRGHIQFPPLHDFQKEVRSRLRATLGNGCGRALVTLPTGAGKTRVAVETIRDWLGDRIIDDKAEARRAVLWLAHTEELCEQAHQGFREVWEFSSLARPATLVRFWGDYTSGSDELDELSTALDDTSILISTPGRMISLIRSGKHPELEAKLREHLALVVVDEAHRAGAPGYKEILERYTQPGTRVFGLTATPFRLEYDPDEPEKGTRELVNLFGELIEARQTLGDDPRNTLQERRVLAKPLVEVIQTAMRFRLPRWANKEDLTPEEQDRLDHAMAGRADSSRRRSEILERLAPIARQPGNSVLYFGPTVADAETMCFYLRRLGIRAEVVSGTTRPATRRRLVESFRRGDTPVLCNCQVLTTGFDAPRVTHVVIGRPTVSRVLFEQMVGRGLRGPAFGGTETCEILVFRDEISGQTGKGITFGYEEFRKVWEGSSYLKQAA